MSSDNFYEDIKRAEKIERSINDNMKIRSEQVAKGQSTGGVSVHPLSPLNNAVRLRRPTTK